MSKRAIYLDDRERDLARRVCGVVVHDLTYCLKSVLSAEKRVAFAWTRDEIDNLSLKFEEPDPAPLPDPPARAHPTQEETRGQGRKP